MNNVLITGSNKGIGLEIARQLGKKGFHVIISGRNEASLTAALAGINREASFAEMVLMDVRNEDSVNKAADQLRDKNTRLDVLINNAGISMKEDRSLSLMEFNIMETIMDTNSYGPLRVIQAFLPLMNKPSRIINISSGGGSMTDPVGGWSPAYCVSKAMLNALTRQLAFELKERKISVNAVCPGWVRTDMGGVIAPRSVEQGADTAVWLASEAPFDQTGKFFRNKSQISW